MFDFCLDVVLFQLRTLLKQHGIEAKVEHTNASLEDVFVVATRREKRGN